MSNVDTFMEGVPAYDQYLYFCQDVLRFQGKTLNEWLKDISMPFIGGKLSISDLEDYNHHYLNTNELIMRNLGISRSCFDTAKMEYENAVLSAKQQIINDINESEDPKRRMPAIETLNNMAKAECSPQYSAYKISELFYEFWKIQYDRLKLIDNRLESLNILKRYGDV